jgi:hypothetical protein
MNQDANAALKTRSDKAAVVLIAAALALVLELHLLPALFAGLLVHVLVHALAPRVFGSPGVIAAPVFYAYAKAELVARKLV